MPSLTKNIQISSLLDIYGKLLSAKQQQIMFSYYYKDFTLSEIAEINNISRQAVLDAITKSENKLKELEEKVGMFALVSRIKTLEEKSKISKQVLNELLD